MTEHNAIHEIFPTLYYQKDHNDMEAMNSELLALILEDEKRGKKFRRVSLVGGHRSDRKFFEQENQAVQDLRALIVSDLAVFTKVLTTQETKDPNAQTDLADIELWGWSVILREGNLVTPHLHKRCNVAGSYYVHSSVEDNDVGAGQLVFADPRVRAYAMPVEDQVVTHSIIHRVGRIVLFPSFLEHYVLPFKGPGARMSIAFNIRFRRADL